MLSEGTITQLKTGVYNKYGIKRYPSLKNVNDLDEVIIRETHYDYLNLIWLHKMDIRIKPDEIPWICKHASVLDKKCIIIQCIDNDKQFAKVVTNDIELLIWIDEIKEYKPNVIPKREIYEINELEYHGVKFNSTPEKLDDQGLVITNLDHYDNYFYEIYDEIRGTYKHLNLEKERRYGEALGIWIEEWIDNHSLTNDIDIILEFWSDVSEDIDPYIYKFEHEVNPLFDRNTYGYKLYEEKLMNRICERNDIPITVGWDIWKIKTIHKLKAVLKYLDDRFE